MKLITASAFGFLTAFAISANAVTLLPEESSEAANSVSAVPSTQNPDGTLKSSFENVKGDVSQIKTHVKEKKFTDLTTDKSKLDQDIDDVKTKAKSSFSFGSGSANPQ